MKRVTAFLVGFVGIVALNLLLVSNLQAQVQISAFNTAVTIDFNGWRGAGFTPTPGFGQLDSDDWAITGLSTGNLNFRGTQTSGDFARGVSTGGVSTGGLYALDAGGGDYRFMIQPSSSDFTPGTLTLRIQNNTGQAITELDVSYEIYVNNDQNSIYQLDFSYSDDNVTYTTVAAAHYETPGNSDALGFVLGATRTVNITGINIPNGGYFYLRWTGDDVTGGARDEIALDNITITAPAPTANIGMYVFSNNSTGIANPGLDLANVVFGAGTDDALSSAINLPFTFYFNGQPYNQVKISSNGWVALGYNNSFPSSLSSVPLNDPENWEFNNTPMLAVLWDDLRVGNNGAVSYEGNSSEFKVRWRSMEWGTATSFITFELTLMASGNGIRFSYGSGTNNTNQSATVGLINDADENAPNNYLVFNGNVTPGNEVQDANANANTKLITYNNLPPVVSSVPSIATQHYDAIAVIASSPLDFGSVDADGGTATRTITLVNVGANAITVNGLVFSNAQFSSSYSGTIAAGAQAIATITFTGNCPSSGLVTGIMTVNVASGVVMYPNNGTNLPLQGTETHPDLAVSGTLNFPQTLVGSSTSLTITLTNNGTSAWSGTLSLTGTGAASFSVNPAIVTVNPGQSVDVTVTFAPTGAGHAAAADPMTWIADYSGVQLVVPEGNQTCNGGADIATLNVSAQSLAPRVSIAVPLSTDVPGNQSVPTLDLGNRIFGPSAGNPSVPESFSEQFLVKNTGSADLTIAAITNLNSGNLNDRFSATAVLVTGSTNLAPGDEAVYRVTYTPQVTSSDFPWSQGTSFGVKPSVETGATSYSFDAVITNNSQPVPTDAGFWHNYANGAGSTFGASENLSQAGTLNATIRLHRGFLRAIKAQANSSEQAPINTAGVPKLNGSGLVIREGGVDVPATDVGDAGVDLEVTSYWGAVNDLLPWGGMVTFAGTPGKTSFYIVNNGNAVATFYVRQSIFENGVPSAAFTLDGPFASSGVSYQSVTINGESYVQFTLEPLYSQDPADPANNLSYVRFDVVFSPTRANTPDLNNIGADRIGTIEILTDANLPTGAAQSANLMNTYSINVVGHVKYYDPAMHVGTAIADNVDFGKHELADATSSDKPLGYYAPAEELARRGVSIPTYFGVRDTVIVYTLVNHGNAPMQLSAGDIQAFALTGAPGAFHVVKVTTPELIAAAGGSAPADAVFPFDLQPLGWTGTPSPSASTALVIWVHYDAGTRSTGSVGVSNGVVRLVQSFVGVEFPTVELQYSAFGEGIRPFPVVDPNATGVSDVVIDGGYTRPAPVYRAWREAIYDNYCGLLGAPANRDTVHLHLTVGNGIPAPTSVGNVNDGAVTPVYLYFDQAQVYQLGGPGNNVFVPALSDDFSIDYNTPAVIRDALGNPVSTVDLNATPVVELPAYHTLSFDVIFRPSQLMPPSVGSLRGVVRIPHSNRNNDVDFTYDGDVYKYLELIVEGSSLRPALRTELGNFAHLSFGANYLPPNAMVNFDLPYPYRPGVFSGDSNFVAITLRNSQETGNTPTGADFSTGKIGIKAIFIEGVDFPDFEIVGFDLPSGVSEPNPVAYPVDPVMLGALGAGKSFIQWVADLGGGATIGTPYVLDIHGVDGKPAVNLYIHFKPRPFVDGQRKAKRHAVLRIITTDICQPEIVFNLEGTALFADVAVDPPQIDFGNVQLNDVAQQTITVTNNGNFPAYFETLTLPGMSGGPLYSHQFDYLNLGFDLYANQPNAYNLIGDTQTPLLPGQSRTLVVEFSPTQVGRRDAQLDVTYIPDVPPTVGVNVLQVPITGKGVNPVTLSLDPSNGILDFGNVFVGQSAQLTLQLINNGDADVTVQLPPASVGPFSHDAGSGSVVVAANSSLDITFTFTPTALGSASASFTFYSPDAMGDQYYEVTCVGNGISAAAFSNDMIDFGAVRVFTEASSELYIDNSGGAYDVVAVFNGIGGPNNSEYRVEYQGTELQAGDVIPVLAGESSDPIIVTFAPNVLPEDPSQPNIRTAQLNFTLDGASVTIDLSGDGAVPQIEFSGADIVNGVLDFGTVDKTVGAQRTVTVTNIGRYPLAITQLAIIGAHADAFQLAAPSGIEVGAGESFDVVVTLLPGDELDITDARLIAESNSIQPRSVELRGLRAVPGVALSSTSVEFGDVRVGEVSNQVLTIRNATGLPVEVRGLSLSGPAQADFTIVSVSEQLPTTLQGGEEVVVTLRFVPTEAGDKFARLYVETNTGQAEVQLYGRAVAPGVALSAQTLNFGSLPVGRSREMSLSITNTGTAPLVVYSVKVEGEDAEMFRADNTVGFTLQPGASQTVRVTFTPLSSGLKYAFLRFVTDEYGVISATLMGIGGAPEISVASTLDFGEVTPNSFRELQLTVTNNGDAPLEISEALIVGPAQDEFNIQTPTPILIASGSTGMLTIRFAPTTGGEKQATLRLINNTGVPAEVQLVGRATVTSVDTEQPADVAETAILRVDPMPVQGSARITYVTSQAGAVRLALYDAAGREILRLYEGVVTAGQHMLTVELPAGIASGSYFLRMDAGGSTVTYPVTVAK